MTTAWVPDLSPRMGIDPQSAPSEAQAYSIHLESIQYARERAWEKSMATPETLTPRINRRDHREYVTEDGDLVIARRVDSTTWLVTAHSNDLGGQAQGQVWRNEAGFRGRQWESAIDQQQHASLMDAMREAVSIARQRADLAAFARTNPERRSREARTERTHSDGSRFVATDRVHDEYEEWLRHNPA